MLTKRSYNTFMTELYRETKFVSRSKYLVVYTSAKRNWDLPEMPKTCYVPLLHDDSQFLANESYLHKNASSIFLKGE